MREIKEFTFKRTFNNPRDYEGSVFFFILSILALICVYTTYNDTNSPYSIDDRNKVMILSFLIFLFCFLGSLLLWPRFLRKIILYDDRIAFTRNGDSILIRRKLKEINYDDISGIDVNAFNIEIHYKIKKIEFINSEGLSLKNRKLLRVALKKKGF